ncbi:MAG: glycerophosphodiester phosphodiesterase [Gammaproteobacteria bacterium]|nr:glycerophosphodiester phosphodiesterase [Gammaproteobacteria bacterium]
MSFFNNYPADQHLIAAHRGVRSERPENTLSAFRAAVGRCDFIEMDVRLSRDGIPVIIHDERLDRTSDIAINSFFQGEQRRCVHEFDFHELQKLDVGSWFLRDDPFSTLDSGKVSRSDVQNLMPQKIMSLDAFLDFATVNCLMINIEIKDMSATLNDAIAVGRVLDLVKGKGCQGQALISSYNESYLQTSRALAPEITTAKIQDNEHPDSLFSYLNSLGVGAYHVHDALCDQVVVSELKKTGIAVNVFTINDDKRRQELFQMGVRGVFTDFL